MSCGKYVRRADLKCKKTRYGIKRRNDLEKDYLSPVQFCFAPWGKIETQLSGYFCNYEDNQNIVNRWYLLDNLTKAVSSIFKIVNPKRTICGVAEVIKNKEIKKCNDNYSNKSFLFQVFSRDSREYSICIEFLKEGIVFLRESVKISKGYNQCIIKCSDLPMNDSCILVRYYPENNIEVEVVVLFSEFVLFNNYGLLQNAKPSPKIKCVAWDLDNTVWEGILIESNPNTLKIKDGVLDLIKALDERGIIQVVVSKNDISDVEKELKRLNIYDQFVHVCANWNPKSNNLQEIANWLNINIDTFALIDDSDFERGEVRDNLPCVRTYTEKEVLNILNYPEFDVAITEDGKNRRIMYQIEAKRKGLQSEFTGNMSDFIRSCEMVIILDNVMENNFSRCFELVQRTNQLNLSGVKYSEEEFRKLVFEKNRDTYVVTAKDKYGNYGQVGFVSLELKQDTAVVFEYVMSCRVASKLIEPSIIRWMCDRYSVNNVAFEGNNSRKNGLLISTLVGFGLVDYSKDINRIKLAIGKEQMTWESVVKIVDNTRP